MRILLTGILPALVVLGTMDVLTHPGADAAPADWRAKVTAAKMLDDEGQKREALAALVREAWVTAR